MTRTNTPTGKPMRRADYVRVIRAILEHTHPAGNGGYVADIGPLTYGRMVELAEVVVPLEGDGQEG